MREVPPMPEPAGWALDTGKEWVVHGIPDNGSTTDLYTADQIRSRDAIWAGMLEKVRRDAERYRWLRKRVYKDEGTLHCQGPLGSYDNYAGGLLSEMLDEAIDAAIRGKSEGECND
jgi:hypothetical protein